MAANGDGSGKVASDFQKIIHNGEQPRVAQTRHWLPSLTPLPPQLAIASETKPSPPKSLARTAAPALPPPPASLQPHPPPAASPAAPVSRRFAAFPYLFFRISSTDARLIAACRIRQPPAPQHRQRRRRMGPRPTRVPVARSQGQRKRGRLPLSSHHRPQRPADRARGQQAPAEAARSPGGAGSDKVRAADTSPCAAAAEAAAAPALRQWSSSSSNAAAAAHHVQ